MDDELYGLIDEPYEEPLSHVVAAPIDDDLPCRHCGYNLRGLTEDRACPECGTAVGRSLLGDQLRFSDPDWVDTLARGANWILWSALLGILLGIAGGVVEVVMAESGMSVGGVEVLVLMLSAVSPILWLIGIWLITSPEPGVMEQTELTLRLLLRWTAAISIVVSLVSIGLTMTDTDMTGPIDLVSSLVGLVSYFALFVFARRLALRVPDYELAKQTRIVMWGIVVSLGGIILFGLLLLILGATGSGPGIVAVGIPMCVLGVSYLVFAIWSLVLLFRYSRLATLAARLAERTWARDMRTRG